MRLISNDAATPTTRVVRIALDGLPYPYLAGQAAGVAVDGQPLTPYSIASAPQDTAADGYLEFLIKVDGSTRFGSQVGSLAPGIRLTVSPPSGRFTLPDDAAEHALLFVAGGTGIAPLRSMLRETLHRGDRTDPPALIYSARTPEEFAYADELLQLHHAGRLALTLTLTGTAPDWVHARGRAGRAHLERLISERTLCFVCGPPAMLVDVPEVLTALGLPRHRIRTEDW